MHNTMTNTYTNLHHITIFIKENIILQLLPSNNSPNQNLIFISTYSPKECAPLTIHNPSCYTIHFLVLLAQVTKIIISVSRALATQKWSLAFSIYVSFKNDKKVWVFLLQSLLILSCWIFRTVAGPFKFYHPYIFVPKNLGFPTQDAY
jgi:hypothetical protein